MKNDGITNCYENSFEYPSLPRERIISDGVRNLTDEELLAAIIGSGQKGRDVKSLSRSVLKVLDTKNGNLALDDLLAIDGIGTAKACLIAASLEFARRRIHPEGTKIRCASDILPLVQHLLVRKQEHFVSISLNGAHEVITTRIVSIGMVDSAPVHPREVFAEPLMERASSVIVAHNHPSGDLTPSQADKRVTAQLKEAATILGLRLLDHVIFSTRGIFSFQEEGLL